MPRREFLQQADTYNPKKHKIGGFYMSEKLDGTRCFWDGGISRGQPTKQIPWANTIDPKTGETKSKVKPYATGLWSRYGNPIMAPDWWLDILPPFATDGELWAGRGNFQLCRSICGGDDPDSRFDQIRYAVYSFPSFDGVFQTGTIKNANFHAEFDWTVINDWLYERNCFWDSRSCFEGEYEYLQEYIGQRETVFVHQQHALPHNEDMAGEMLHAFLNKVMDEGGEGVVLRDPNSTWTPKRHSGILKYKPFEDAEAVIIGYRAGKEGKIGQALGKIGTLVVRTTSLDKEAIFEIGSGLTLEQRELDKDWRKIAQQIPGDLLTAECVAKHFSIGDVITFKYRELSDDGIPKEGRFWRKRGEE